jgi:hypothetical protein
MRLVTRLTRPAPRALVVALVLGFATPTPRAQTPVPTTLSYQAVLTDPSGTPVVDGSYTVALRLFPVAAAGTAAYAETHNVTTVDGVFSVELGAGTPVTGTWAAVTFDKSYWLETAVGATTLSPRTRLLAGPYARALTLPYPASVSVAGYLLDLTNTNATGRGIQAVVTGATGVRGESAASTGAGVAGAATSATGVSYGGFFRSASTSGQAVYGQATAPTGTTYGVYGTSQSSLGRGVLGIAPYIGVYGEGTETSAASYGGWFESAGAGGFGVRGEATSTTGFNYGVWGRSASTGGTGVYGTSSAGTGATEGVTGSASSTGGTGVRGTATSTSGATYGGYFRSYSSGGRGVYGWASAASGATYGGYFEAISSGGTAVYGTATATSGSPYGGAFSSAGASGRGVYGAASGSTAIGVQGVASATSGVNYGGYFESMSTGGRAVVGEAEAASGATYGGYFTSASATGYGLYANNSTASGIAAYFGDRVRIDNNTELYDGSADTQANIILDVDEGGEAPAIKLLRGGVTVLELDADHNGDARVITEELEITGGSALAEHFDVAPAADLAAPLPGMVVSIHPDHDGQLAVSSAPYDPLVAGVVSGAGGIETGLVMGQHGSIADGDYPIALVGRVYVLVDAAYGPVRRGDLLTTSATPGHAMRASDRARAPGAVLGKAMTALESGRGLVLVLVGLQ